MQNCIESIKNEIIETIEKSKKIDILNENQTGLITALQIIGKYESSLSKQPESVIHPDHYNKYSVEVIEMMTRIYGAEKTAIFCELNAFKSRMRMGAKPENPIEIDLQKEQWYLRAQKELLAK